MGCVESRSGQKAHNSVGDLQQGATANVLPSSAFVSSAVAVPSINWYTLATAN